MLPITLTDPNNNGEWAPLIDWPLIAIHSMVLPDGRVISYGTSETGMQGGEFVYALYDFETNTSVLMDKSTPTDIFCSNMGVDVYLDQTLIIGGDGEPLGERALGVNDVNVFDYRTNTIEFARTGDMNGARWYPTVLTLGNGDLLTLGGRSNHIGGGTGDTSVEIFQSGVGWNTLDDVTLEVSHSGKWWYPTTWLRSDGQALFFEGTSNSGGADFYLIDAEGEGTLTHLGVAPFFFGVPLPSILYRTDKGLVMDNQGQLWSVDFSTDDVQFEIVGDLGAQRIDSYFTQLADGRIAITGGTDQRHNLDGAYKTLVIWDPDTESLTYHEDEELARLYHASTLLLPDGSLIAMGGGAPGPLTNTNAQIWAPEYLFSEDGTLAPRIDISSSGKALQAGERFILTLDADAEITRITAVKSGASTHSKNADSRFLELDYTVLDGNTVEVSLPENTNELTAGTWMVFVFDGNGVPSVAELVDVDPGTLLGEGVTGHYAFGTSTYMLGTAGLTWEEAKAEAESLGGRLLEIETQAENDFIRDTFFKDNPIWLGINDLETEGVYQTQNGNVPVFENWTDLTAVNRNEAHSYGIMTAPDGTWRMSRIGPSPAYFDEEGRPSGADAISIIEFEHVRDVVFQSGDVRFRTLDENDWFTVTYDAPMDDPIVVVSPPTLVGGAPVTVRVRNVTSTGFEVQLDEWDYLDGRHAFETMSWMAVERGVHTLSDGAVIEAGSVVADPSALDVSLAGDFGVNSPVVIGQVTSTDDTRAVTERISDVTQTGFTVRLQQEESQRDHHGSETFDYVAFELGNHNAFSAFNTDRLNHNATSIDLTMANNGDHLFAELQTVNGLDPVVLRIGSKDDTSADVVMQEEASRNAETAHAFETLGWVAVDEIGYSTGDPDAVVVPEQLIAQTGSVDIPALSSDDWYSVQYTATMDDPIVVISPPTKNGGHPVTVRVRNVTETGFEVQLDEWDYLDGRHGTEALSWLAVERGIHELADGSVIEAGSSLVGSDAETIALTGDFAGAAPTVLAQVASANEATAVTDRISEVTADSFVLRVQEQESLRDGHALEQVDWVAFETGQHEMFSAFNTDRFSHTGGTLDLTRASAGEVFFADLQTFQGADPVVIRLLDQSATQATLELQEERSANTEMAHARETVGWVMLDEMIFG